MLRILRAHGLDAGPTQRPLLAGAIAGLIADIPAIALLGLFGSLGALGPATGTSSVVAGLAYGGMMLLGGVLYGWLFQRAANDPRGGWLFGLAFGFVLWILVPIPLLQWLPDEPVLSGRPALGLLLGQLLWGFVLGVVFPFVHRRLHIRLNDGPGFSPKSIGPEAAAQRQPLRDQGTH
jgi:Na+/proline symporter